MPSTSDPHTRRVIHSSASDNWPTPPAFFAALQTEFGFVLDVCADRNNRKTPAYYGRDHDEPARRDGRYRDWAADAAELGGGAVWCNPPYGRGIRVWMANAAAAARAGTTVVCLVPARTDTRWFHDHVLAEGAEVRFVRGRLKFGDAKHAAPFASLLVIYRGAANTPAAEQAA